MRHRTLLTFATLLVLVLEHGSSATRSSAPEQQPATARSSAPAGQTATRLADGRWLLAGGEGSATLSSIWDPQSNSVTPTAGKLVHARAWHTATLLPDGSVLVAGGIHDGRLVDTVELFDAAATTSVPITIAGSAARASHSATLLIDGRVLIVGGTDPQSGSVATEIWDPTTQVASSVGKAIDRRGHRATLTGDGRVLLDGGQTPDGTEASERLLIDPTTGLVAPVSREERGQTPAPPFVAASIPSADMTEVAVDGHLALRFSDAMLVESITTETVSLKGPDGPVTAAVIAAEEGHLAFVWPSAALAEGATYELRVSGVVGANGVSIVPAAIRFTTARRAAATADVIDDEAWAPDLRGGANGWRTNRPPSPWESLPPLMAPPGVTAVSGRVLRLDGRPLPDVTLEIDGRQARSDRTGRFLLTLDPWTSRLTTLEIDARTANRPNRAYGFYEALVGIRSGVTTVLPFTIWSPLLDTAHQVTIPSPTTTETIVSTPLIPGLELHLPAGTVIRDEDGEVARRVSITPIPLDRTPFPLPQGVSFPAFFTIQPGGAYLSTPGPIRGGWIVYPSYGSPPVGSRVQFFNYDPEDKGWYPYGMGTVTPTRVVPDARTRIYSFTGLSFNDGTPTPPGGQTPGGGNSGDPVDPSTGAFIMTKTDLSLPDVMPIVVRRTYNSLDPYGRAFGIGMSHSYGMFEHSESWPNEADMYLPDGGKLHFARVSAPGLPTEQTVFEHAATPTAFYKARMTFWGDPLRAEDHGWNVTLQDGTVYVYPHAGSPLQAIRDRYGNETRLTWGAFGTLSRITSPNGRWIAFSYGPGNRVSQIIDNIGRTVLYTYDGSGRLSTVTDPENNVTTYTWDANNRLETIKDGRQIVYLTNHYDANGRVDLQTLADPAATYQFAYATDASGAITQTEITNPRGYTERLTFENHYVTERLEAVGQPEERRTTFEREAGSNLLTATVDGLLRRTEYEYDDTGHLLTLRQLANSPEPVVTRYTYEPRFFQLATVTDPLLHTWTIGYDGAGRLVSATDPLTHQTTFETNGQGRVISLTDPLQHTWQFGHTGGDKTSITNPLGAAWQTFFDAGGRLLSSTDPLGRVTRVVPDKLNQLRTVIDPLGGQTSFEYDPNGRMLSLTDALTHATNYAYDTSDRVSSRTDPLQAIATYLYDPIDNLTQVTDRKGQVTVYQYDPLDRLKRATYADTSTVEYVYDAGDRLRQIVDSAAGTITRDYDGLDRLTSEATPEGAITYTYDLDGRRETMTVAGQPTVTYAYDDAHRLTSITQGTSVVSMTYDDADRRDTLTLPNGIVTTSDYDNANQLTSLTYTFGSTTLGTLTYTYDDGGKRTSVEGTWARTGLPQAVASATYDPANRIQTWAGTNLSYDPNGNLTSDGLTSYTWNARSQLASLTGPVNGSFAYDGFGRRRSNTIGGTTTQFLYDGLNPVQELSGGTPTGNLMTGLGIDEYFTRTDTADVRNFLTDALGSTVALADGAGAVQTSYTYEPFGRTTASGTSSGNTVGFTGREADGTGFYFFRARYYAPGYGRFMSEDPIRLASQDANFYEYVWSDPVNRVDPTGLYGTNDCSYYTKRCQESGGRYYCVTAPYYCERFPRYPDPDPKRTDDFEGWARCVRKCLQDCDKRQYERECRRPNPDPTTDSFWDAKPTRCHTLCYSACAVPIYVWLRGY